jgi:hypothetical protein
MTRTYVIILLTLGAIVLGASLCESATEMLFVTLASFVMCAVLLDRYDQTAHTEDR